MAANPYLDLIDRISQEEGVDPAILKAMADQESKFNPKAIGAPTPYGRAMGMMQILPSSAGDINPMDPEQAVRWAARYIKEAQGKGYTSDEDIAQYYHGGPDTKLWGPKTKEHGRKVSMLAANYRGDNISFDDPAEPSFDDTEEISFDDAPHTSAARTLATHRWTQAKKALDPFPLTDPKDIGPDGMPRTNSPGFLKLAGSKFGENYDAKRSAPEWEALGLQEKDQGIPDLPAITGYPLSEVKEGGVEGVLKGVHNVTTGASNMPAYTLNFFKNLVQSPTSTAEEVLSFAKDALSAGIWAGAGFIPSTSPADGMAQLFGGENQFQRALRAKGIDPDRFVEAFLTDPINTGFAVAAPFEAGRRGVKAIGKGLDEMSGGIPQPGDFNLAESVPRRKPLSVPEAAEARVRARKDQAAAVRKLQEDADKAAEAKKDLAVPPIPDPATALLEHDRALLEHRQFHTDLTMDTPYPVENRAVNIPSESFKNWSMEKGFDQDVLTMNEWGEWLDQSNRMNRGFTLTDAEVKRLADTAKEKLAAEDTSGLKRGKGAEKARAAREKQINKGIDKARAETKAANGAKGKKGTTASFLGTQELYDLAVHFAQKIPSYAAWVGTMIKHVGQIGAARLRALWDGAHRVLRFDADKGPEIRANAESVKTPRTNHALRAAVTQKVTDWRQSNRTYLQAVQAIEDAKAFGKITGAEESALMREAQKQYSENTKQGLGPSPEPTGQEFNPADVTPAMSDFLNRQMPEPSLDHIPGSEAAEPMPSEIVERSKALDPYLQKMVEEFSRTTSYTRDMLAQMVENLGGDPADYLPDAKADLNKRRVPSDYDLPRRKKKRGFTLSSLGGQELYERTVELAADMGRAFRQGAQNFDQWSARVRAEGAGEGIRFEDAHLRDAWERLRPIPSVTQAAQVTNTPDQAVTVAADGLGAGQTVFGVTRPQMRQALLRTAPRVAEAATEAIQAKQTSALMAKHDADGIRDILREGTNKKGLATREENFVKILWDYRARALDQKAAGVQAARDAIIAEQARLGPDDGLRRLQLEAELEELHTPEDHRMPRLTPEQRISLMNDPAISSAVQWWDHNIRPRIERESQGANIRSRLRVEPQPGGPAIPDLYARVHWKPIEGSGRRNPSPFRARARSRSSIEAKGNAPMEFELSNNIEQILYDTYEQRLSPASVRRLNEAMAEPGMKTNPDAVAAYELAMRKTPDVLDNKIVQTVSSAAAVPMLMLPAEATTHALGVLGTAGRLVWGNKLSTRALETMGGIYAKQAIAIKRAMTLGGPEMLAKVERWNKAGLLRAAGMSKLMEHRSIWQKATDLPGLRIPKKIVFGHPGTSRLSLMGLETRYRIAMAEAMLSIDPTMSDAQVAHHINNAVGTYVSKLAPTLARYTSPLTPFSRARTALPKSAVNYMIGRDIQGNWKAGQMLNAAWSTVLSSVLIARMLDKDNQWLWEKKNWSPRRPITIDLADGRRIEIPLNLTFNAASRALQTTGINNAIEAYIKGERSPYKLGAEIGRGLYNYGASFMGPHMNAIKIGLTGQGWYQTGGGPYSPEIQTMQGAEFSPGEARGRAVLETLVPPFAKFSNSLPETYGGESGKEAHPTDPTWDVAYGIGKAFGVAPLLREAGWEDKANRGMQPVTESEFRETFYSTLAEARNIPPDERLDWVLGRIENNFSDAFVMTQRGPKPARVAAMELLRVVPTTPKRDAMGGILNELNAP